MGRPSTRPKSEVSLAITRMRENQGDTMEAVAARLKVALNTVSRWENLRPPRGKSLQKLYEAFAKRHGHAASAETFLRQLNREHDEEYRRIRTAVLGSAENVQDLRVLLRELWELEETKPNKDPFHDALRRTHLLKMADCLWLGGRDEFLGEGQ